MINDDSFIECESVTIKYPGRPDAVIREAEASTKVGAIMAEIAASGKGVSETVLTIEVRLSSQGSTVARSMTPTSSCPHRIDCTAPWHPKSDHGLSWKKAQIDCICARSQMTHGWVLLPQVRKAGVPTLELVDLPGIVAASIEGEPADMMERTRRITELYLAQPNTVVVAVVPANITRVRDSQAIQLIQRHKKEDLSIGVLAKADLAYDPRWRK